MAKQIRVPADFDIALGKLIDARLKQRNMTKLALALAMDIDRTICTRITKGERSVSARELKALASALDLPLVAFADPVGYMSGLYNNDPPSPFAAASPDVKTASSETEVVAEGRLAKDCNFRILASRDVTAKEVELLIDRLKLELRAMTMDEEQG